MGRSGNTYKLLKFKSEVIVTMLIKHSFLSSPNALQSFPFNTVSMGREKAGSVSLFIH